ncbi:MAG: carbohydrate kinase family protein [Patescibacteria group bacterium]|nr:carbohydrate kinase family protein [Patescibacteria group bacterium]
MDFLAVGDIVIDAFIKLKDARVHCNINNENCEICMRWGDKIPYELAVTVPAVGNSSNAAVAAARLGLSSALRAYVGNDQYGQECLASLVRDKVDIAHVEKSEGKNTNYHYVLWYDDNRTILVKHETFEYTVPSLRSGPAWLYLSSLGENSLPYHYALVEQLKRWPETKLAFQPGTYQMKFGREALKVVYARADIFFCNKEEAERILEKPAGSDIKELLAGMQALGPKIVVITDDKRGCYSRDASGAMLHCPRYPDPRPPFEITGAGDALASGTTSALALGLPLSEALKWGSVNASAVLQEIGAQKGLLAREQLEHNVANPPAPWELQKLE